MTQSQPNNIMVPKHIIVGANEPLLNRDMTWTLAEDQSSTNS